jgi:radical SAM protein (TIGR01212 family)
VDGGFTCPNRDGTAGSGGCSYCANDVFRSPGTGSDRLIEDQLRTGISFLTRRFQAERFLVYWQHYSNTYAATDLLRDKFTRALQVDARIIGMAVGTRPDCVEDEKLKMLQNLARSYYVCMEYGLESIHDKTLRRVNRGHDLACFIDAVERTKNKGLEVCVHLILGFPNESRQEMLAYCEVLNKLKVDFVKIHHLHVIQNTPMAQDYDRNRFALFASEEWIQLVCDFLERLDPNIVIQRLYGWAPDEFLVAPRWGKSKAQITEAIRAELEGRDSWQGKLIGAPCTVTQNEQRKR